MVKILFVFSVLLAFSCADKKQSQQSAASVEDLAVKPSDKNLGTEKNSRSMQHLSSAGGVGYKPEVVADFNKTKLKAKQAFLFCKTKKFNTKFCVLIDMSLHSGLNRFFVWDFKKHTVVHSFLVGHGCGNSPWSYSYSKTKPVFSNKDGSHCTVLGKYKIGERGYSSWGINVKYLMYGLDETNSNALARQIVFHGWNQMPDAECYPYGSPEGWGCPTLSNKNMRYMDDKLRAEKKSVLMWIYQ